MTYVHICPDSNAARKPCLHYIKEGKPGFCSHREHFRCIEYCIRKSPVLSYSYISAYTRCFRYFYWSYLMGWENIGINLPSYTGSMVHDYQAYSHGGRSEYLVEYEKKRQKIKDTYNNVPNEVIVIKPILEAYHELGYDQLKGMAEQSQLTDQGNFQLKSITDLKYDNKIMDYKFCKDPDIYTLFKVRRQAGIYFINNPEADEIIYRCIKKPRFKKIGDEPVSEFQGRVKRAIMSNPTEYIVDKPFSRGEFDLDYLLKEIEIISDDIVSKLDKPIQAWIQDDSGCFAYGSWCDYKPLCDSRVNPDGLPHLYKRKDVEHQIMEAK